MAAWTTADIARELNFNSPGVARSWIRRSGINPLTDRRGDAKLYDPDEVLAAKARMVGQGKGGGRKPARTEQSLPETEGSPHGPLDLEPNPQRSLPDPTHHG